MARIAGVNLPNQKRLEIGLTYIYGIGQSTAQKICKDLELDPDQKVKDLTDDEVTKLRTYIDANVEAPPEKMDGFFSDTLKIAQDLATNEIGPDELARANMQLFELNNIKNEFMATMTHELRTPLNSILGFSDVLAGADNLTEKQQRYLKNIQTSGKVLLEMINDILDLAKIESGKMEVRLSDFSVAAVLAAQCDMARPLTERKNIDLEIQIEPAMPDMFQDQAKVQQILNNLLSNAIKFTPEGGRIVVSAAQSRDTSLGVTRDDLVLKVADTGVGIAEEDQTVIFEKFRQGTAVFSGGDAMTREYSGTGLGLSIVKELCKLLGGEISLESQLGKGSTFTVKFPVRAEAAPPKPHVEMTKPRPARAVA